MAQRFGHTPELTSMQMIVTADAPGTGTNLLDDGYFCFWHDTVSGKTYSVARVGADYKMVELT